MSAVTNSIQFELIFESYSAESLDEIRAVNNTIPGWDRDINFIHSKYQAPSSRLLFDMARLEGKCVGYVIMRHELARQDSAYLSFVAVKTDQHGKGIGSALMRRALCKASELGKSLLCLDCRPKNIGFYRKFASSAGISFTETRIGSYRDGSPKIRVEYEIDASRVYTNKS